MSSRIDALGGADESPRESAGRGDGGRSQLLSKCANGNDDASGSAPAASAAAGARRDGASIPGPAWSPSVARAEASP